MGTSINLSSSLENYLEVIGSLIADSGQARSQDIASRLNVKRSSVTVALRNLSENGLIQYQPYNPITLTAKGKRLAQDIIRRHQTLRTFLHGVLGVNPAKADAVACQMEHAIGEEITERLTRFVEFLQNCPRAGEKWIRGFEHDCEEYKKSGKCKTCMELCIQDWLVSKEKQQENEHMVENTLDTLSPGEKCSIEKIGGNPKVRQNLVGMGITKGAVVEMLRIAPLGDPVSIRIKGYELSLRKEEASCITVKRVQSAAK